MHIEQSARLGLQHTGGIVDIACDIQRSAGARLKYTVICDCADALNRRCPAVYIEHAAGVDRQRTVDEDRSAAIRRGIGSRVHVADVEGALVSDVDAVQRGAVIGTIGAVLDIEQARRTDRQRAAGYRAVVVENQRRRKSFGVDIDCSVVGNTDPVQRCAAVLDIDGTGTADRKRTAVVRHPGQRQAGAGVHREGRPACGVGEHRAAHRVVVQRQCRANRHGARVQRGAGNRAYGAGDIDRPRVADEAAVDGVAVRRQRGASVDRERRVGVGQRVAAGRRGIDHLQRAIIGDRAAAVLATPLLELHRVLNRDAAASDATVGAAAHRGRCPASVPRQPSRRQGPAWRRQSCWLR